MAITELDPGGAERAFARIACGLKQLGWPVSVISLRDAGRLAAELESNGITVTALHCGGLLDVRAVARMAACLQAERPDVLLTFLHQANIVGRLAAWRARVPVVVSGVRVADRRWSVAITERPTRGLVTAWTAVSDSVAITHCRSCGIDRRQMHTIFNGVDVPAIDDVPAASRGESGLSSEHFVVLVAGRLTSQKAPGDVLEALALWRDTEPDAFDRVQLVYAGDGPQRPALGRAAMELKLYDRVQFPGVRTDLPALMKASDVLVLASRWEGLPNVVLEAMAARLPVIASAVDGTCELVTDGQTGRLYPAGDVSRLAELLAVARRSPESSATMAVAARALVEAKFRWDVCIAAYDTLLRRLWSDVNEPRSGSGRAQALG